MSGNEETFTTSIYFVRHGECKANVDYMNLPPEIDVITEKGKLQAALFGKHFHDVAFTKAFCSTYSRAYDTATEILANLDDKPELKQDARIRERELGEYENQPIYNLFDDLISAANNGTQMLDFEVKGGETVADLEGRMSSFLAELLDSIKQSKKPETILIVSHGVIIIHMLMTLRAWSKDPARSITLNSWDVMQVSIPVKNAGYHLITVEVPKNGQGSTIIDLNKLHQTDHLESLKLEEKKPPKEYLQAAMKFYQINKEQCVTH